MPAMPVRDALSTPSPDFAPYRLSGVVYGVLLNDPAALAALGDAVHRPPYRAPPVAPVLYLKPRNTLAASGSAMAVPAACTELELGAALGLVIARSACRVDEARALEFVAGYTLVADVSVPHASLYRPSVPARALDGSCVFGPRALPRAALPDPDALEIHVEVDGVPAQCTSTAGMSRPAARLLAAVTDFMTLRAGDVLLLGVKAGAPRVRAGQRAAIEAGGLGRLECRFVADLEGCA